ncbi:dynamin family protein [Streptomyces sp. NPDC056039]|uniref:dynamin family protein n=1 Tax=Streptomyces sp. NPDC056039 TaxID=3345687 RepID=UPI0035D5D4C4
MSGSAALRRAALDVLRDSATTDGLPETFRRTLADQAERLSAPFSVALVGRVSTGKSTLVNALLGERIAPTGVTELTMTVNRFRHGTEPSLTVRHLDGTVTRHQHLSDLESLTVRSADDPDRQALLRRIDHLETRHPHGQLAELEIIDTPGLDSFTGPESASTLRLLGRTGQDLTDSTLAESARADAMVLTFTARGAHRDDIRLTAEFMTQVPGLGPLNTVGVLNKVELLWDPDDAPDPMRPAGRVADQLIRTAGTSRLLYSVVPVAGLLGSGAACMDAADLDGLSHLATTTAPRLLAERAADSDAFTSRDTGLPLSPEERARLFGRFGGWGVVRACRSIREGADTVDTLRGELLRVSGVDALRALLRDHFGGRADLIKAAQAFRTVPRLAERTARSLRGEPARAVEAVAGALTAVELRHSRAYAELRALRDHFDGRLDLPAEQTAELLRVTGEHGTGAAARLGLPTDADHPLLLRTARARLDHWHAELSAPTAYGASRQAQLTIRQSYEALHHHIASGQEGMAE